MRILSLLIVILLNTACNEGKKAHYKAVENFKKLDEKGVIEALSSDKESSFDEEFINNELSSEFSFSEYYVLLAEKIKSSSDMKELTQALKTLSFTCTPQTLDKQIEILFLINQKKSLNVSFIRQMLITQKKLIAQCPSFSFRLIDGLKTINSIIFTLHADGLASLVSDINSLEQILSFKLNQSIRLFNSVQFLHYLNLQTQDKIALLEKFYPVISQYAGTSSLKENLYALNALLSASDYRSLDPQAKSQMFQLILDYEYTFIKQSKLISIIEIESIIENHSVIFSLETDDMISSLEKIVVIDQYINDHLQAGPRFLSLSSYDLKKIFDIAANSKQLSNISKLIKLHRDISPHSKLDRSHILTTVITQNGNLEVFKRSTSDAIIDFMDEYLSSSNSLDQSMIKNIFNILLKRVQKLVAGVSRFEDINEILNMVWKDYSRIYRLLNLNKVTDKRYTIIYFNQYQKAFDRIYELPLNRVPTTIFLRNIHGEFEKLALSHLIKVKADFNKNQLINEYPFLELNKIPQGHLENLLNLRLSLFLSDDLKSRVNAYCSYLNDVIHNQNHMVEINYLSQVLTRPASIGCYQYKQPLQLSDEDIKNDVKHKIYQVNKTIDNFSDVLIKVADTDITLESHFYKGPIWYLPSLRNRGQRSNPEVDLDASASPVAIDLKLYKENSLLEQYSFFYNYNYKAASEPQPANYYLAGQPLIKGHRGGNLTVSAKDQLSLHPQVLSVGSEGEKAPDTILPGKNYQFDQIYELLESVKEPDTQLSLADYLFMDQAYSLSLSSYDLSRIRDPEHRYLLTVNKEVTQKLHSKLCGQKVNIQNELCYLSGNSQVIKPLNSLAISYLDIQIKQDFRDFLSFSSQSRSIWREILFSFPSDSEDPLSKAPMLPTKFDNGPMGESGSVVFKIQ